MPMIPLRDAPASLEFPTYMEHARHWGKTFHMYDAAKLFQLPTIITKKELTMRLTKAQKAKADKANAIAIAKAKDEQHLRLIERLQQDNIILGADNAKLSGALTTRTSELHTMAKMAEDRARDIAAFKQEVLALTTENATLRGYMARVLEDDTVREVGGAKPADTLLCEKELSHMQQALHQDNYARRQPPRSVRTGPCPPITVTGCDMAMDVGDHFRAGSLRSAPKHWMER